MLKHDKHFAYYVGIGYATGWSVLLKFCSSEKIQDLLLSRDGLISGRHATDNCCLRVQSKCKNNACFFALCIVIVYWERP